MNSKFKINIIIWFKTTKAIYQGNRVLNQVKRFKNK